MSGLDEQIKEDARILVFFTIANLYDYVLKGKVEKYDILYIDEAMNNYSDFVKVENLKKVVRGTYRATLITSFSDIQNEIWYRRKGFR